MRSGQRGNPGAGHDVHHRLASASALDPRLIALSLWACTACCPDPYSSSLPSARRVTPESGLTATFLGTSSLLIDDGDQIVLADGFLSRPSPLRLLLGPVASDQAHVVAVVGHAFLRRISTLLVAHAYQEHVMDAAWIIRRSDAIAWGAAGDVEALLPQLLLPQTVFNIGGPRSASALKELLHLSEGIFINAHYPVPIAERAGQAENRTR